MKKCSMRLDDKLNPIPVLSIGCAKQVIDSFYKPDCPVVRLCAEEESFIWSRKQNETHSGYGLLMPAGSVEYFSLETGYGIEVDGVVNITEMGL